MADLLRRPISLPNELVHYLRNQGKKRPRRVDSIILDNEFEGQTTYLLQNSLQYIRIRG